MMDVENIGRGLNEREVYKQKLLNSILTPRSVESVTGNYAGAENSPMLLKPVYETLNNPEMSGTIPAQVHQMIINNQKPVQQPERYINPEDNYKLQMLLEDLKIKKYQTGANQDVG